jgi:hypothetical protein
MGIGNFYYAKTNGWISPGNNDIAIPFVRIKKVRLQEGLLTDFYSSEFRCQISELFPISEIILKSR